MFTTLAKHRSSVATLALRLGLASIFMWHGFLKLTLDWGAGWTDVVSVPARVAVAWGELACGLALALGLLTQLTCLGLIVIQAGAVYIVMGQRHFINPSFTIHGINYGSVGYEYNFALIVMCFAVMVLGSGVVSLDCLLWSTILGHSCRGKAGLKDKTAEPPPPAGQPLQSGDGIQKAERGVQTASSSSDSQQMQEQVQSQTA